MNSIIDNDNARRERIANSLHATVSWADYEDKWYALRDADDPLCKALGIEPSGRYALRDADDPQDDGTPVYATSAIETYLEWHGRYGANNALDFDPAEVFTTGADNRVAFADEWEEVDPPENAAASIDPRDGFRDTMIVSSELGFLRCVDFRGDVDLLKPDNPDDDYSGYDNAAVYWLNDGTSLLVNWDWIDPILRYPGWLDLDDIAFDITDAELVRLDAGHQVILPIPFPNGRTCP